MLRYGFVIVAIAAFVIAVAIIHQIRRYAVVLIVALSGRIVDG